MPYKDPTSDAARASSRRRSVKYRAAHPEQISVANANWQKEHPEQARAFNTKFRVNNPDYHANERFKTAAHKAGVYFHDVLKSDLFKRDKGICQLCLSPVDPNRYDMDHVIPFSLGGEHTYANTWIAHPFCNKKKSNRVVERGAYRLTGSEGLLG